MQNSEKPVKSRSRRKISEVVKYEDDLIYALQQGDGKAFEKIYNCYARRLIKHAYAYLHNKEESEDIVQEVFVGLWAKRQQVVINISLSAYLYAMCTHKVLNYLRARRVTERHALAWALNNMPRNSTEELMDVLDLQHIVAQGLLQLSNKCQAVFRLSREQYQSIQEIAACMNISPHTVTNYLTLALKHLHASCSMR